MRTNTTLHIVRGQTFQYTWRIFNDDGTPKAINGTIARRMRFKRDWWGVTVARAINFVATENGVLTVTMPAEESEKLEPGRYVYDVRLEYDDRVDVPVGGDAIVLPLVSWVA